MVNFITDRMRSMGEGNAFTGVLSVHRWSGCGMGGVSAWGRQPWRVSAHEQNLKDLSNTCQVSVERRVLDLESEVQWFNAD